ncbi:MAG: hypothetical protein AAB545_02305 [Patescibacteria group bacterium]
MSTEMPAWKDFGPVWVGSGTLGFFGEGWWFHPFYRFFFGNRFNFSGATFVAKTVPVESRRGKSYDEPGNMVMDYSGESPRDFFPDCIALGLKGFIEGWMQNSVGLSGPGAGHFFYRSHQMARTIDWTNLTKEGFFFSYASTRKGKEALQDAFEWVQLASKEYYYRASGLPKFAIQYNVSCPNTEHDSEVIWGTLAILGELGPVVPKFGLTTTPEVARDLVKHPACMGLHISNTLLFGETPILAGRPFDWRPFARKDGTSRLKKYGGGGLSGKPLLKPVCQWVRHARKIGIDKPINAGGGILHRDDIDLFKQCGADGISFASVAVLRPWNIASIIERAHQLFT